MFNVDVRNAMKRAGFYGYEVAAFLGVSETSFSRSLSRKELPSEQKDHIFRTIEKMAEGREKHD